MSRALYIKCPNCFGYNNIEWPAGFRGKHVQWLAIYTKKINSSVCQRLFLFTNDMIFEIPYWYVFCLKNCWFHSWHQNCLKLFIVEMKINIEFTNFVDIKWYIKKANSHESKDVPLQLVINRNSHHIPILYIHVVVRSWCSFFMFLVMTQFHILASNCWL